MGKPVPSYFREAEGDSALAKFLEKSVERGVITDRDLDEFLPDEGGNPFMTDMLARAISAARLPLTNTFQPDSGRIDGLSQNGKTKNHSHPLSDPVRDYIAQAAQTPLLSRAEEIRQAKIAEVSRALY